MGDLREVFCLLPVVDAFRPLDPKVYRVFNVLFYDTPSAP
jgi:hypothetical protein